MSCPAIKLHHYQVTGLRLEVHACLCQVAAWAKLLRIGYLKLSRVAGEFGLGSRKFEIGHLSNDTATPITAGQPSTLKRLAAGLNRDAIGTLLEIGDRKPALDLDTQGIGALNQHRFKLRHFRQQVGRGRARQAILPLRSVNIAVQKWNACKVSALTARPLRRGGLVGISHTFM